MINGLLLLVAEITALIIVLSSDSLFMSLPFQTSSWRHALHLSVCSLVTTFERSILKMNEPILVTFDTSGPWNTGVKLSTLEIRESEDKVTRG